METGRKRAKNVEANRFASSAISASFEYLNSIVIFRGGSILLWNSTGTARERHGNGWWEVGGRGKRVGWIFPSCFSDNFRQRKRQRHTHTQKKEWFFTVKRDLCSPDRWLPWLPVEGWRPASATFLPVSTRFYPFHARSVMNFQMFYMSIVRLLVFDSLIQLKLELIQSSIGKMDLTWSQWGRAHLPPK